MVKRTQAICQQEPTNCLSMFDHFVGLALKGLSSVSIIDFMALVQSLRNTRFETF